MAESTKVKVLDRDIFVLLCRRSVERGFNRRIELTPAEEAAVPSRLYPIVYAIPHEHIAGVQVEPHMRVVIGLCEKGGSTQLDIEMETYNALPEIEVPA